MTRKSGEKMAVQWQPKVVLPIALGLMFVLGFLFGNMKKACPEYTRVVGKDEAESYKRGSIPSKAEKPPKKEEVIYVNLSQEESTLASSAKTVDKYLHEPLSCAKMANFKPSFVFFIFSVAANYDRRQAIRDTWGKLIKAECGLRLIFVLSVIESNAETRLANEELQTQLDKEAELHQDVLQFGQIIDGSRTLTRKAQMTFQWFLRECPNAEYIAKGEDHTWVNLAKLTQFVTENKPDCIFGHRVYSGSPVFRDPKSYFYVSREDYIQDTYPEYMTSMMYVIPKAVLVTLLAKAKEVHEIPLEEIYWTGIVADFAKIPRKNTEGFEYDYIIDRNRGIKCPKKQLMAVRYMPPTEFYKYEEDKCYTYLPCNPVVSAESSPPAPKVSL